ncbi:7727_t:CDS:2, partial [Funneliformis geosporum]
FHSILGGKILQEDYNHAQNVWNEFGCKNLGEYNNLYLKIDVPSLADDAMLKMTKVKIELFTEMAMHDFIEKAKYSGIAIA